MSTESTTQLLEESELLVPIGVSYKSIVSNPNELITLYNSLRLLQSVPPKLECILARITTDFMTNWEDQKAILLELRELLRLHHLKPDADADGMRLESEAEIHLSTQYEELSELLHAVQSVIPDLRRTGQKTSEQLQKHISYDGELEVLRVLYGGASFFDAMCDFFDQVDDFEAKTMGRFTRAMEHWTQKRKDVRSVIEAGKLRLHAAEHVRVEKVYPVTLIVEKEDIDQDEEVNGVHPINHEQPEPESGKGNGPDNGEFSDMKYLSGYF